MIKAKDKYGNQILAISVKPNDKNVLKAEYKCIICCDSLKHITGHKRRNGIYVEPFFSHKNVKNCQKVKLYEDKKYKDNCESSFVIDWLSIVLNNNNKYNDDIVTTKEGHNILFHEKQLYYRSKLLDNIDSIVLSHKYRSAIIYNINDEYYMYPSNKSNEWEELRKIKSNIYLDLGKDMLVKISKNEMLKYGYLVDLIEKKHFIEITFDVNVDNFLWNKLKVDTLGDFLDRCTQQNKEQQCEKMIKEHGNKKKLNNIEQLNNEIYIDKNLKSGMMLYFELNNAAQMINNFGTDFEDKGLIILSYVCGHSGLYDYVKNFVPIIDDLCWKSDLIRLWATISLLFDLNLNKNEVVTLINHKCFSSLITFVNDDGDILIDRNNVYTIGDYIEDIFDIDKIYLRKGKYDDKFRLEYHSKIIMNDNYHISVMDVYNYTERKRIKYNTFIKEFVKIPIRLVDSSKDTFLLMSSKYARYEQIIKNFINQKIIENNKCIPVNKIKNISNLVNNQLKAFNKAIKYNLSVIIGFPGTGKSQTISVICDYLFEKHFNIYILAYTGKAVDEIYKKISINNDYVDRNIKENVRGVWCVTIDSFINFFEKKNIIVNEKSCVIIDEFSMVSIETFSKLITIMCSIKMDTSKMIIVGDNKQLPSIDYGNVLNDLIYYGCVKKKNNTFTLCTDKNSELIPVTELTEIHRTSNLNDLYIKLRNDDKNILFNILTSDIGTNYKYYDNHDKLWEIIDNNIKSKTDTNKKYQLLVSNYSCDKIFVNNIEKIYKSGIYNTIYLACTRKAVKEINDKIRGYLFENTDDFAIGDKLMCTKNGKYNNNLISNGSIYYIHNIIDNNVELIVESYIKNPTDNNDVKLITVKMYDVKKYFCFAYAITIHKSQSGGWKNVIILLDVGCFDTRCLYTAVTRSEKKCTLIATKRHLQECINRPTKIMPTLIPFNNYSLF